MWALTVQHTQYLVASSGVDDAPSVFLPDTLDFDKPVRPEIEEVLKPSPSTFGGANCIGLVFH